MLVAVSGGKFSQLLGLGQPAFQGDFPKHGKGQRVRNPRRPGRSSFVLDQYEGAAGFEIGGDVLYRFRRLLGVVQGIGHYHSIERWQLEWAREVGLYDLHRYRTGRTEPPQHVWVFVYGVNGALPKQVEQRLGKSTGTCTDIGPVAFQRTDTFFNK